MTVLQYLHQSSLYGLRALQSCYEPSMHILFVKRCITHLLDEILLDGVHALGEQRITQ